MEKRQKLLADDIEAIKRHEESKAATAPDFVVPYWCVRSVKPDLANMRHHTVVVKGAARDISVPCFMNVTDIAVGDEVCMPLKPRVKPLQTITIPDQWHYARLAKKGQGKGKGKKRVAPKAEAARKKPKR